MKNRPGPSASMFVLPPSATLRDDVTERASSAHANDQSPFHVQRTRKRDHRPDIAMEAAPQRVRARQTEPRTAEDCHARVPRRPRVEAEQE